jgi:hypothetical protein
MIAPEKCMQLYLAMKAHFTTEKYDVIKYNARIKGADAAHLEQRRDRELIRFLAKKLDTVPHAASFFVANFARGNDYPFSDEERSFKLYTLWQRNRQSLTKVFKDDCSYISNIGMTWHDLISLEDGIPPLFILMKNGKINIESVAIMNELEGFIPEWEKKNPLWKEDFRRIRKLKAFIKFDKEKFGVLQYNLKIEINSNHETV